MARPRSEEKRNAILEAATTVIARRGPSGATAEIARAAGVAEGTLFNYFANKNDLLNQLYLRLQQELADFLMRDVPDHGGMRERLHHAWLRLIGWGIANPYRRKALVYLSLSKSVSVTSRPFGALTLGTFNALIPEGPRDSVLRSLPAEFLYALLGALAETTIDFMTADEDLADRYRDGGFEALCGLLTGNHAP